MAGHRRNNQGKRKRNINRRGAVPSQSASCTAGKNHRPNTGFITRRSVFRDARLKQVVLTPKAQKLHQQIEQRLDKMEELLTEGISDQELEQFMATVEKLKKNLS